MMPDLDLTGSLGGMGRLTGNDDMPLKVKRIDEGGIDGDLCCIVSSQDLSVVCMIWPTAAKLKQLKQLTEVGAAYFLRSTSLPPHTYACNLCPRTPVPCT